MKRIKRTYRACGAFCLVCALLFSGCAAGAPGAQHAPNPGSQGNSKPITTILTANLAPVAVQGETANAAAVTQFGALLMAEAMKLDAENPVISPLSAYFALAMAADGAAGDTLAEFGALLGLSGAELDALCAGLAQALTENAGSTELSIANSAWIDTCEALVVEESWLNAVKAAMGAEAISADLSTQEAVAAINDWVKKNTNGLIPSLREEPYQDDVMFVLLNALYFKAKWQSPFEAEDTHEAAFTVAGGEAVQTEFMQDWGCYRDYIESEGVCGTVLPYDDGKTAFLALLPREGADVRAFAATLDAEQIASYLAAVQSGTYMDLLIPKFTAETEFKMNDALKAMGLVQAFDPEKADFTAMGHAGDAPLYIGNVLQKVKLIVDEEGTEAAAVTSVEMAAGCAMPPPVKVELRFDRPFAYAVIDLATGVPMFLGVMENPEA